MVSIHLSESVTYFRYYTRRKDKYFFTSYVTGVFTHITLQGGKLEFTCQPKKEVRVIEEQYELILNSCLEELRSRKLVK